MRTWQRLGYKDREKVMDNIASHEDWKSCFCEIAPGLLLFARQWVQSAADAEDAGKVQSIGARFAEGDITLDYADELDGALAIGRDVLHPRRSIFGEAGDLDTAFEHIVPRQIRLVEFVENGFCLRRGNLRKPRFRLECSLSQGYDRAPGKTSLGKFWQAGNVPSPTERLNQCYRRRHLLHLKIIQSLLIR